MSRPAATCALLACLIAGAAGCRTFDPKHPVVGRPEIDARRPGYWIWVENGQWHVRVTGGGKYHRFQGSIVGVSGSVAMLEPTRAELRDRVALDSGAVQFDLDQSAFDPRSRSGAAVKEDQVDGFDARVLGGCGRFDLLVDGHPHPEWVRLGPKGQSPRAVPFERCP